MRWNQTALGPYVTSSSSLWSSVSFRTAKVFLAGLRTTVGGRSSSGGHQSMRAFNRNGSCHQLANSWSVGNCRPPFWLYQAPQLNTLAWESRKCCRALTHPKPGGVMSNPAPSVLLKLLVSCCIIAAHKQQTGFFFFKVRERTLVVNSICTCRPS